MSVCEICSLEECLWCFTNKQGTEGTSWDVWSSLARAEHFPSVERPQPHWDWERAGTGMHSRFGGRWQRELELAKVLECALLPPHVLWCDSYSVCYLLCESCVQNVLVSLKPFDFHAQGYNLKQKLCISNRTEGKKKFPVCGMVKSRIKINLIKGWVGSLYM